MTMNILRAKYSDGRSFLQAYQTESLRGGLFIPTRKKLPLGSAVVVDVRFAELRSVVLVRGFIAWRRAGKNRSKLRAGLGVEFLASETRKCEFLRAVAEGGIIDLAQRRHRRLPVDLKVGWREKSDRTWQMSVLEDIGEGGAFIRTTQFLPIGSSVILEIAAPGGERKIPIEGRVTWTLHTPNEEGIGVEFRCRDSGGARLLQELVRRIERLEEQQSGSMIVGLSS
jgi:Tfp pilus assembly protein PilZ